MKDKKAKKKVSLCIPILWIFTTIMWIITVCINSTDAEFPRFWLALQCATAVISGGAAIANYIRYKRSNGDNSER